MSNIIDPATLPGYDPEKYEYRYGADDIVRDRGPNSWSRYTGGNKLWDPCWGCLWDDSLYRRPQLKNDKVLWIPLTECIHEKDTGNGFLRRRGTDRPFICEEYVTLLWPKMLNRKCYMMLSKLPRDGAVRINKAAEFWGDTVDFTMPDGRDASEIVTGELRRTIKEFGAPCYLKVTP